MIALLLAGCHHDPTTSATDDGETSPTDVSSTPVHSAPVGHTGVAHSADPAHLRVAVLSYYPCQAAHTATTMGLTALPDGRNIAVTYGGPVHGCGGCQSLVTGHIDGDEIQLWLDDDVCDEWRCCELEGSIRDVPAGTWTVTAYAGSGASAVVELPGN
ncbi:MAG: hypothetical protein H6738_11920 [Alphaproteobacteria bacterium]|nr:hypothetical protein [Alphaproteobacteria bacterium]